MKSRFVDFNRLVGMANFLVAVLIAVSLPSLEPNPYLDRTTLGLGLLLCLQTQIALSLERRWRDPFVLLLTFSMVLYFSLRLFTLTQYPVSAVFYRYSFEPSDANFALVFMLIANVFMYAGLFAVRMRQPLEIDTGARRAATPLPVLGLMVLMIVFSFLLGRQGSLVPRAIATMAGFLAPILVVTMAMVYFFLFRRSLSRTFVLLFVVLILLEMVAHTLAGSRSAIVGLVQIFLLSSFAVTGEVKFSKRLVWTGVLMLPLVAVVLVASFALSTASRAAKMTGVQFDIGNSLSIASAAGAGESALSSPAAEQLIGAVLARAGFFDFSAEIIAHRDRYAAVINLPAYGRSFVDNILTPGFDLYDQPKIANAISFVYRDWGAPSKRAVAELPGYQSDQIGIYGEFYVLFGYASLPLFFVFAGGLKWMYARVHSRNPFLFAMMRVVILALFVRTIDSFGFDWTVGEVLPIALATVLYSVLFASHTHPQALPVPARN